jgi:AraC-like DNA-binding protein
MEELRLPVDPLGEALYLLRMNGVFYSRSEFTAPWGMELPPFPGSVMFHVVTAGRCWLEVAGSEPVRLQPGVLALVPHGDGHRLVSDPGAAAIGLFDLPREQLGDHYEIIRHGGGAAPTNLICGAASFGHPAAHQMVRMLPRVIAVDTARSPQAEWLEGTLRFMEIEAQELRLGGETVMTRLADALVIHAIRSWIEDTPVARQGWLGALRDRPIGRALALIHRDPTQPWTVASLAREAAMSRSVFAARFQELVGEPPMHYVAKWRMHVAQDWLKEEGATVGEIASRLGYESDAAFSRAFKRIIGVPPVSVKRTEAP